MNDSLSTISAVPAWASFFTGEQHVIFLALIADDLRQRQLDFTMADGIVRVRLGDEGTNQFGLQNLAQMCLHHAVRDWEGVIHEHFSSLLARRADESEPREFEACRGALKVRLYADDFPEGIALVSTPVAPGVTAVLTLDLPDAVVTVTADQAAQWGQPVDELLAQGIENALGETVEHATIDCGNGASLQVLEGESFFVTTQVLELGDWLPYELPHGALVAVPNRHLLLFHPIEDLSVVNVITTMLHCTQQAYRQGPGSLSRDLYWWRDGHLSLLPSCEEDGRFTFTPPSDFLSCLESLANPS